MSFTDAEVNQLVADLEEPIKKAAAAAIREALTSGHAAWKEYTGGGSHQVIEIPVVYVGTVGIISLDLEWKLSDNLATFESAGGGSLEESYFISARLFMDVVGEPNTNGYHIIPCGPGPVTLYTLRAVKKGNFTNADIIWDKVWLNEVSGVAELKVDGNGSMRIEVKEVP